MVELFILKFFFYEQFLLPVLCAVGAHFFFSLQFYVLFFPMEARLECGIFTSLHNDLNFLVENSRGILYHSFESRLSIAVVLSIPHYTRGPEDCYIISM
jgi:hypothetical protein